MAGTASYFSLPHLLFKLQVRLFENLWAMNLWFVVRLVFDEAPHVQNPKGSHRTYCKHVLINHRYSPFRCS